MTPGTLRRHDLPETASHEGRPLTFPPPLVSVIMASYNHARFVTQAIESVWKQSHQNVELIVIDDGSTDESAELIERLRQRSPIPMQFRTQENSGPAATFNRGLDLAAGKWVCILASDDFYPPDFIERNLKEAAAIDNDQVIQHANAFLVEHDGRITGTLDGVSQTVPLRGEAFELLVNGGGRLLPCTMFLKRELLLKAGQFDPAMIAEDCDLHLRLARVATFHYIEDPIFYSRHTPGSLGKKPWLWGDSITGAIAKHGDILGDRLPHLLARASSNVSARCFEHGEWRHGLRWAGRAIHYAPHALDKTRAAAALSARIGLAMARHTALRLFGRDRLVRVKRALFPSSPHG